MYFLLDANIIAGYYLPRSLSSKKAADRIPYIIDSVRSGGSDHFLYIPNFCIAEVFGVFAKYSFGRWNRDVKKAGGTVDSRVYESLCKQFKKDIHNGKLIYHLELSRYHVLAVDLVAPIDHYFKFSQEKQPIPAGAFDHLIVAMGMHLSHIHGRQNVCIITADSRLAKLVTKCRRHIPEQTANKLKLYRAEEIAGKPFSEDLFPRVLNLASCSNKTLKDLFQEWPLQVLKHKKVYRWEC